MANVRMRIITLDGDVAAGDVHKLVESIFPSPHPPVENIKAANEGFQALADKVMESIRNDKPFELHLENRKDELRKTPAGKAPTPPKKGGRQPGSKNKPKPAATSPTSTSGANEAPAKS